MVVLFLKSLIIGVLAGAGAGAGAARMFFIPKIQAAGAFRTLGEINACQGDAISHLSFGGSFFLNSAAMGLATGVYEQDILHRVVPNFAAGILLLKNKKVEETLQNPGKMAIMGGIVGAVVMIILNNSVALVPSSVSDTMTAILNPAIQNMVIVMQVLYLIAALDNGKTTGCWGLGLGAVSFLVTGNATPGAILGILTGQTIEKNGIKSKTSAVFIILMVVIWTLIAYFRGFFPNMLAAFQGFSLPF